MKKLVLVLLLVPSLSWAAGPRLNHCVFDITEGTVNTDGTSLTDLASFKVYIGTTSGGPYTLAGTVPSPSPTGGVTVSTANLCSALPNGQKYAVATAVDTAGNESPRSPEVPFDYDAVSPKNPGVSVR